MYLVAQIKDDRSVDMDSFFTVDIFEFDLSDIAENRPCFRIKFAFSESEMFTSLTKIKQPRYSEPGCTDLNIVAALSAEIAKRHANDPLEREMYSSVFYRDEYEEKTLPIVFEV